MKQEHPNIDEKEIRRLLAQSLNTTECNFKYSYLRSCTPLLALTRDYPVLLQCGATRTELRLHGSAFNKYIADQPCERVFWKSGEEMLDEEEASVWLRRHQTGGALVDDSVEAEEFNVLLELSETLGFNELIVMKIKQYLNNDSEEVDEEDDDDSEGFFFY